MGFTELVTDENGPPSSRNPYGTISYDSKDEYNSKVSSSTAIDALNELRESKYEKTPDVQKVSEVEKNSKSESAKNKDIDEKLTPVWESYNYKLTKDDETGKTRKAEDSKPAKEDTKDRKWDVETKRITYRQNNKNGNKETKIINKK